MSNKPKSTMKSTYATLLGTSRDVGKAKCKKDSSTSKNNNGKQNEDDFQRKRQRSPSPKQDKKKEKTTTHQEKKSIDYDIPDRSFGDLYCKICDSHMNSDAMWAAHIIGKRHLKNTRGGGDTDLKYDYLDEPPSIQDELDQETEPVVGLQHICEIQRMEQRPIYQCFLCSANVPNVELLKEHVKSLRHRLAYLKEHDPNRHEIIHKSDLKKGHIEPVVTECVAKHEADFGRGKMSVKRERQKVDSWKKSGSNKDSNNASLPRKHDRPDDNDYRQSDNHRSRDSYAYSEKSSDYYYDDRKREYTPPYSSKGQWHTIDDVGQRDIEEPYVKRNENLSYPATVNVKNMDSAYYNNSNYEKSLPAIPVDNSYNRISSFASDSRSGDLREILEQKKALDYGRQSQPMNQVKSEPSSSSSLDTNIPDHVLGMFSALPTVSFFQLVLFKLDEIKVESDIEIKLLDRITNKTATMAMDIKTKLMTPTLREKFQESMIQNGLGIKQEKDTYSEDIKQLMDLVGDYRAKSDLKSQNTSRDTTPLQNSSSVSHVQSVKQNIPYKSGVTTFNNAIERKDTMFSQSPQQNSPFTSWPSSTSTSLTSSNPFSSASTTTIPGLTFISDDTSSIPPEKPMPSSISPFDHFARKAKDILGRLPSRSGYSTRY